MYKNTWKLIRGFDRDLSLTHSKNEAAAKMVTTVADLTRNGRIDGMHMGNKRVYLAENNDTLKCLRLIVCLLCHGDQSCAINY